MLKIGITGGIGSGKTTVCKLFELLGVPVYYADEESKKLLDSEAMQKRIIGMYGESILSGNMIDRKKLAALVFNDKVALDELNKIVHPAVGLHFEEWLKKQSSHYVIKEAAILFESGAYKQVDKVITITSPVEVRIERTIKRNQLSREEVLLRMGSQLSDEEKIKRSAFVLVNNEEELLIPQVIALHQILIAS